MIFRSGREEHRNPNDSGSVKNLDESRTTAQSEGITIKCVERSLSLCQNDRYNEWVVKDYEVIGILAVEPYEISRIEDVSYADKMPSYLQPTENVGISRLKIQDTFGDFPKRNVYSFNNAQIVKTSNFTEEQICHKTLYLG